MVVSCQTNVTSQRKQGYKQELSSDGAFLALYKESQRVSEGDHSGRICSFEGWGCGLLSYFSTGGYIR